MTIVAALGAEVACKSWVSENSPQEKEMHCNGYFGLIPGGAPVVAQIGQNTSIDEIYNVLTKHGVNPNNVVIYYTTNKRFIKSNKKSEHTDVNLVKMSEFIMDFDSDDYPWAIEDNKDMEAIGLSYCAYLHEVAPEYFPADPSFVIVASSSMWKKESSCKFHIHFLLEKPATLLQMKQLLANFSEGPLKENKLLADPAIYSVGRLIFCAPPKGDAVPEFAKDTNIRVRKHIGKDHFIKEVHNLPNYVYVSSSTVRPEKYVENRNSVQSNVDASSMYHVLSNLDQNRGSIRSNLAKLSNDSNLSKFQKDNGLAVVNSIYSGIVRDGTQAPPKAICSAMVPYIQEYIKRNNKRKSPFSYLNNASKLVYSSMDFIINNDIDEDNFSGEEHVRVIDCKTDKATHLSLRETSFGAHNYITYVIWASTGAGKTTEVERLIREGIVTPPVLAIVPGRGISSELGEKLGLTDYRAQQFDGFRTSASADDFSRFMQESSANNALAKPIHGIVTVVNSLIKPGIQEAINNGFFNSLIIDEAVAVLNNISSLVTQSQDQNRIFKALRTLRDTVQHTIMLDGDFNKSAIIMYNKIFGPGWETEVYKFQVQNLKGVPAVQVHSKQEAVGVAIESLRGGFKVLMVSDMGPAAVEEVGAVLRRATMGAEKNIVTYHKDLQSVEGSLCAIMTNTPDHIKQEYRDSGYTGSLSEYLVHRAHIDALLTSPSMTAAQDFQGIFDVIISINIDAQGLNQRMQAIARERKPKAIFFYVDKKIQKIPYYEGYKPHASAVAAFLSGKHDAENVILRQYNLDNTVDCLNMLKESRKFLEQYNYSLAMHESLIRKGANLLEIIPHSVDSEKLRALYKDSSSLDEKGAYYKMQADSIITQTPSTSVSATFISETSELIKDFYGEDALSDPELVLQYIKSKPMQRGEQLTRLRDCIQSNALERILEILSNATTNWWKKDQQLQTFLKLNQKDLVTNSVVFTVSDMARLPNSIGIQVPYGRDRKLLGSLVPEDYDPIAYMEHFKRMGKDYSPNWEYTSTEDVQDI